MSQESVRQESSVGFYNYSGRRKQECDDRWSENYNYNLRPVVNEWQRLINDSKPSNQGYASKGVNRIFAIAKGIVNSPAIIGNGVAGVVNYIGGNVDYYLFKKPAQGLHWVGDQWDKNVVGKLADAGHNPNNNIAVRGLARIAAGVLSPVSAIAHIPASALSKVGDIVHNVSGVVASVPRVAGSIASSILTMGQRDPGYTIPAMSNMWEQIKATGRNTVQFFTEPVHNLGSTMRVMANAFDTPIISQSLRLAGTVTQSASMFVEGALRGNPIRSSKAIYYNARDALISDLKTTDAQSLQDLQNKHKSEGFVKLDNVINKTYVPQEWPQQHPPSQANPSYSPSRNIQTFDQAQQAFQHQINTQQLKPFAISSNNLKDGNGTITYVKPGDPNDKDHQVTYKYENGKLTDIAAGKNVSCVLPPIQKENGKGFEWSHVVNGQKQSLTNTQHLNQKVVDSPRNTPPTQIKPKTALTMS